MRAWKLGGEGSGFALSREIRRIPYTEVTLKELIGGKPYEPPFGKLLILRPLQFSRFLEFYTCLAESIEMRPLNVSLCRKAMWAFRKLCLFRSCNGFAENASLPMNGPRSSSSLSGPIWLTEDPLRTKYPTAKEAGSAVRAMF